MLSKAYVGGLSVQSDWARTNAQAVAMTASLGLLTTFTGDDFGRTWRPTPEGLHIFHGVLS